MVTTQSSPGSPVGSFPLIDYESHPAYGGMFEADPGRAAAAIARLDPVAAASRKSQAERLRRLEQRGDPGAELSREMASEGFAILEAQPAEFETFAAGCAPMVEMVQARIDAARAAKQAVTREVAKLWLTREEHAPLFAAATRLLTAAGAMEAVKGYYGADSAKVRNLTIAVARPGQSWSTRLFKDVELETPATTGFHIDTDPACVLKTVIYLSDVGPEQGAFGCIPQSHLWDQDSPNRARARASHKNRLTLMDRDSRHTFASLPKAYQLKASFGGDMLEGSPDSLALLASEQRSLGPRGRMTLFDPETIHRGGHVDTGERIAVIAGMGAIWSRPEA